MSVADVFVLDYLTKIAIPLVAFFLLLLCVIKKRKVIKKKIVSTYLANYDATFDSLTKDHKIKLFSSLSEIQSYSLKLREKGVIRILEIGVRTGENIKYYPKNSDYIGIDRNLFLKNFFAANPEKISNVKVKRLIACEKQDLSLIADCSMDAIVGTLVLCKSDNVALLLSEIRRVLVPGGTYYLLEHTCAPKGTVLNLIQRFLSVTKIWPKIFDNCHLNVNVEQVLENARFKVFNVAPVNISSKYFVSGMLKHYVSGTAVK